MSVECVAVGQLCVGAYQTHSQIIRDLLGRFEAGRPSVAVAVNPEKVLMVRDDESLFSGLYEHAIFYADGVGVVQVLRRKLKRRIPRLAGCDLWLELMRIAGEAQLPVFLIGATPEVLASTADRLHAEWNTPIVGREHGYFTDPKAVISKIKQSGASIVTVAMGSPKQERFIAECIGQDCSAVYLGVGGAYDVYVGKVKRAPKFVQRVACEWLYRLICEPRRIRRQVRLLGYVGLLIAKKL